MCGSVSVAFQRWWDNLRQRWVDGAEGRPVKKGKKTRKKKTRTSPQPQQEQEQQEQGWRQEDREAKDRKQEERTLRKLKQGNRKEENVRQGDIIEDSTVQERKEENVRQGGRIEGSTVQERKENIRQGDRIEESTVQERNEENVRQGDGTEGSTVQERGQEDTNSQKDGNHNENRQKDRREEYVTQRDIQQKNINQEDRKQDSASQEDKNSHESRGQEDITPQTHGTSETLAAHHIGQYIGVTKFITEDTDLLEVVRSAIRTEKVTEEWRNGDDSGIVKNKGSVSDTVDNYTSSATLVNAAHTNTSTKNLNTRQQTLDTGRITKDCINKDENGKMKNGNRLGDTIDNYASFYATSVDVTRMNATTKNIGIGKRPLDIEKATNECGNKGERETVKNDNGLEGKSDRHQHSPSHTNLIDLANTTTNTNSSPPPPDPHQQTTTTCTVDETSSLGLVGLHTCGNLASSSLRLFTANPRVTFLCNVGCCYHLLEEEFSRNTYNQQKTPPEEGKPSRLRSEEDKGTVEAKNEENDAVKSSKTLNKQLISSHKEEQEISITRSEEGKGTEAAMKRENDTMKSSEQVDKHTISTHKEEAENGGVSRSEEGNNILEAMKEENNAFKSSIQVDKQTRPVNKGETEKNVPGSKKEKEVVAAVRQENEAAECSEQVNKQTGSVNKAGEEKNVIGIKKEKEVLAAVRQENDAVESSEQVNKQTKSTNNEKEKNVPGSRKENEELAAVRQENDAVESSRGHIAPNLSSKSPLIPSRSPVQAHLSSSTKAKAYKSNPPSSPPPSPPPPRTTEKDYEGDVDPLHPSRIPNLGHGFPLSAFLRSKRFSLGRNSRMLSSQAADRLTQGNIGATDPLYWRALLQVVLVNRLGDVSHLPHVGRLSAKCHSFPEYAKAALERLGVSLDISEEELQEYDRRHSSSKGRLERFFLLRASLAAVVEGAVLLDRLAYLCEQDDVSAFLVQLFDPVTSPRSHALIAIRREKGNTPSTTLSQGRG